MTNMLVRDEIKHKLKDSIVEILLSGQSMEPLIGDKEKILISSCQFDDLRKFDIVVFSYKERLVCHFVWHKNQTSRTIVTKGLNSQAFDDLIYEDQIVGIVINKKLTFFQKVSQVWKYRKR